MKNASMKSWKVLELIFLLESKLACNHFYVISIHISQKRSMRRIFIQIRTISHWVKQASQLLKIIHHIWRYEKIIRGHVFPYTCVEKLLSNFINHFMYKGIYKYYFCYTKEKYVFFLKCRGKKWTQDHLTIWRQLADFMKMDSNLEIKKWYHLNTWKYFISPCICLTLKNKNENKQNPGCHATVCSCSVSWCFKHHLTSHSSGAFEFVSSVPTTVKLECLKEMDKHTWF